MKKITGEDAADAFILTLLPPLLVHRIHLGVGTCTDLGSNIMHINISCTNAIADAFTSLDILLTLVLFFIPGIILVLFAALFSFIKKSERYAKTRSWKTALTDTNKYLYISFCSLFAILTVAGLVL
jgi:ABC-type multidrug transport system fused ATPase/permease subunit